MIRSFDVSNSHSDFFILNGPTPVSYLLDGCYSGYALADGSFPELTYSPSLRLFWIVGVVLNWWLYGIFVMQYFVYINNANKDGNVLRAIVHVLFILDTVQSFMVMEDIFFWFVRNFGNPSALLQFDLSSLDGPLLDAVITFMVQLVYCWRLRVMGRWKVLPILCALLIKFRTTQPSPHPKTVAVVKRVLVIILETNALTATLAIALTIVFLIPSITPPKTNLYIIFGYTLGKMYSNGFMVLLNQRLYIPKGDLEIRSTVAPQVPLTLSQGQVSTLHCRSMRSDETSEFELGEIHGKTKGRGQGLPEFG
ncbi:hypothetical protein NP233_g10454 [Leucocoprinus birnbaumii]|uniref:DUF6534 domain-containing protein n=1 Tax=Leucocoprinus birnbaumii TaxID=56174 RepID=A0AAD5VP92_9AGAR|nr:hypothetical protein NP233_g10454 [Leucocoprinus birnbaumii]